MTTRALQARIEELEEELEAERAARAKVSVDNDFCLSVGLSVYLSRLVLYLSLYLFASLFIVCRSVASYILFSVCLTPFPPPPHLSILLSAPLSV